MITALTSFPVTAGEVSTCAIKAIAGTSFFMFDGREAITYPHPALKDILKESYGVLTFQEDVLLTVIALAGYSWLDADKFRKAMGKKIPSEMKKQREMFVTGCVKNNISQKKADEMLSTIFESIMKTVSKGEKVTLVGFGTFSSRKRKERKGRNPKTGEAIQIPASTVPKFSAGKQFKQSVNRR